METTGPKREFYSLRWTNYLNNLAETVFNHQSNEKLVDVTLLSEGQCIRAHKLILSSCCGFFQEMFKGGGIIDMDRFNGSIIHPVIVMNGVKFSHLKHIVDFIYQGEIRVVDSDLEGVLALGESMQVKGLCSVKLRQKYLQNENNSELNSPTNLKTDCSTTVGVKTVKNDNVQLPSKNTVEVPQLSSAVREKSETKPIIKLDDSIKSESKPIKIDDGIDSENKSNLKDVIQKPVELPPKNLIPEVVPKIEHLDPPIRDVSTKQNVRLLNSNTSPVTSVGTKQTVRILNSNTPPATDVSTTQNVRLLNSNTLSLIKTPEIPKTEIVNKPTTSSTVNEKNISKMPSIPLKDTEKCQSEQRVSIKTPEHINKQISLNSGKEQNIRAVITGIKLKETPPKSIFKTTVAENIVDSTSTNVSDHTFGPKLKKMKLSPQVPFRTYEKSATNKKSISKIESDSKEVSTSNLLPQKPMEEDTKEKQIPRPPNAFMIFANEWRKKLSVEHPNENNKDISIRLGNLWKSLSLETKDNYYEEAAKVLKEHKIKHPDYLPLKKNVKAKVQKIVRVRKSIGPADSGEGCSESSLEVIDCDFDESDSNSRDTTHSNKSS